MELKLKGKKALVTGSSSGIGEGIAKCLAKEGALVMVHGRKKAELQRVVNQKIPKPVGLHTMLRGIFPKMMRSKTSQKLPSIHLNSSTF